MDDRNPPAIICIHSFDYLVPGISRIPKEYFSHAENLKTARYKICSSLDQKQTSLFLPVVPFLNTSQSVFIPVNMDNLTYRALYECLQYRGGSLKKLVDIIQMNL
jgi:hypothetical protein